MHFHTFSPESIWSIVSKQSKGDTKRRLECFLENHALDSISHSGNDCLLKVGNSENADLFISGVKSLLGLGARA